MSYLRRLINILRDECEKHPSDDLVRQFRIIDTRSFTPDLEEPAILNNLAIQASSYSVVRKHFRVLYPEDIANFDTEYGTAFFITDRFLIGIIRNGSRSCSPGAISCSRKEDASAASSLEDLIVRMRGLKQANWSSYTKKPHSRIILSLATALPKVKTEILADPQRFFDYHIG